MSWVSRLFTFNWNQNVSKLGVSQISTASFPLQFKISPSLWAEPMKKKKRIDPNILKAREERKKKKIEKQIRKLEKLDKQLKPITEVEVPLILLDELQKRKRTVEVPEEVKEERIKLFKEYCKVKHKESNNDIQIIDRLMYAQSQALDELRLESEELYQAAVQIDQKLIPFKYSGPVETPPSEDYPIPDGEYIDISKKWV